MARARAEAPAPRQLALGCAWAWGHGALRRAWRAWSRGQAGGVRAFPLASVRVRRGVHVVHGDEQDCSSVIGRGDKSLTAAGWVTLCELRAASGWVTLCEL